MSVAELPARATGRTASVPIRLPGALGVLLVAAIAIAPMPLGSNRPLFWTLWAAAIGALAITYGLGLLLFRTPARASVARYWPELVGMGVLMAWLGVQLLPLGSWLPGFIQVPQLGLAASSISLDPGSTRLTLLTFATYGLLFLLCAQVAAEPRYAHRMLLAIFLVIAAYAAYGLVSLTQLGDTPLGAEKVYYRGSATGPFINRNSFATFLATGLAIGVPLLAGSLSHPRTTRSFGEAALVLVSLLFIATALLATGSRMGLISGGAGTFVALLLLMPTRHIAPRLALATIVGLGLLTTLTVLFGADTLERFVFVSDETGRAELYRQVWGAILERPWTGYGGGSFAAVFPLFQQPPLSNDGIWDKAHSTYLTLWFELGLVFGSVPVLIVLSLFFRGVCGLWNSPTRRLSVAVIASGVVFGLHSLVDFSAEIMADAFLFTAILALGSTAGRPAESHTP